MDHGDQPITIEKPSSLHGAPMSAIIGYEQSCQSCEYSLRGLAIGANCPECNHPVAKSLKRGLLQNADPRFVRRLHRGARMVMIAALMPLLSLFLVILITLLRGNSGSAADVVEILPYLYVACIWSLFLFGWIRLTTMDPETTAGSESDGDRPKCRIMSIVLSVAVGLGFLIMLFALLRGPFRGLSSFAPPFVISALVVIILFLIQLRLGTSLIKRLMHRIPAPGLSTYATAVYWVVLSAVILTLLQIGLQVLVMNAAMSAAPSGGGAPQIQGTTLAIAMMFGFVSLANAVVSLAAYAMYIGLFSRLSSRLKKVCKNNPVVKC